MRRAFPAVFFLMLALIFLWEPISHGKALLPGEYLLSMQPWNGMSYWQKG